MSVLPTAADAEGKRRAELDFTKEQITAYVKRIKNGEIGVFNEVSSAFKSIQIERSSPEWKLYAPYIRNKQLRKLTNYGLQLRMETSVHRREFLKNKIRRRYGLSGWHVAEFVMNRILSKFITSVMDANKQEEELVKDIEQILNNIESNVTFIHMDTNVTEETTAVVSKLKQLAPALYILTSKGSATSLCRRIVENARPIVVGYTIDEYTEGDEYVVFFKKVPDMRPMWDDV